MLVALGLCLGVWFIYTLDHLLDALNLKENASTRRHTIHYVHQKRIKTILVFVAIILGIMAFYVPKVYYTFCGLLVALTGLHFLINYLVSEDAKRKFFLKEVFINLFDIENRINDLYNKKTELISGSKIVDFSQICELNIVEKNT